MKKLLISFIFAAISCLAADITGTWKGTAEGPNGKIERTFVFKVDGNRLTGETTSEMMGKSTIEDGKIENDSLTFSININFQGQQMKLKYQGKVAEKQMKLHVETDDGSFATDYIAERVP